MGGFKDNFSILSRTNKPYYSKQTAHGMRNRRIIQNIRKQSEEKILKASEIFLNCKKIKKINIE